jgi:hypothetical protein
MINAKEMFELLGYEEQLVHPLMHLFITYKKKRKYKMKIYYGEEFVEHEYRRDTFISIDRKSLSYHKYIEDSRTGRYNNGIIEIGEHMAIHKKLKELECL